MMRWRVAAIALVELAACRGCGSSSSATEDAAIACKPIPPAESGSGTYYAADGTGNCSFDASPNDLMVAAMNNADYANSAWCGACVEVTGPSSKITVRIVDRCPGCAHGDLDLSAQAFAMLAPLSTGRIPITWHEVACPVTGPVAYHFKDGSNAFWTAVQIRNHRYPIDTLEVQTTSGTWSAIGRVDYNYFVQASGLGTGPFHFRLTDARGQQLEDAGITLGNSVTRTGSTQFPSCP
jgi:expansin